MDEPGKALQAEPAAARRRSKKPRLFLSLLVLAVLAGIGFRYYQKLAAETETVIITKSEVTKNTPRANEEKWRFDEAAFAFDLPADWKKVAPESVAYTNFRYQSTKAAADNRFLTIYMDNLPLDKAVNKVVAIKPAGDQLSAGKASDTCQKLPGGTAAAGSLKIPMNYDGVPFLCDNDSKHRNVIGTSSPGSVNAVKLTGPTAGAHTFFFTYEDNNYSPDNTIFYKMLESFKVK